MDSAQEKPMQSLKKGRRQGLESYVRESHPDLDLFAPLTPDLPLAVAFLQYHKFAEIEKGLTKSTLETYSGWLGHFLKWLVVLGHSSPPVSFFTPTLLTNYLHHMHGKGVRPRTVHSAFFPLRGFGEFMVVRGFQQENIAKKVQMPKKDAAIRLTISDEEVEALLDACSKIRNLKRSALATAVFSVLAYSGLRRSEMMSLRVEDVNFVDGSILVRSGKGQKSRRVFPAAECLASIMTWLRYRGTPTTDFLFIGSSGKPVADKTVLTLLDEVKCIAGMRGQSRVCMHSIRHNCATRLLRNGADLGQIKQFLGHSSIQTTEIYLHTGEEDIRGIADKTGFRTPPIEAPQPQREMAASQQRSMRSSVQQKRLRRN